jgi:hypothetical protein
LASPFIHGRALATRATASPPGPLGVVAIAGMRLDPAQERIVGIALVRAAIEGLAVGRRERSVEIEPCNQVRV